MLFVQVLERNRLLFAEELEGAIELGRQSDDSEEAFASRREGDQWRVVVAKREEHAVSRRHVLIEPLSNDRVRLTNNSTLVPLRLLDGAVVAPRGAVETSAPVGLTIGAKTVKIAKGGLESTSLRGLPLALSAPALDSGSAPERLSALELPSGGGVEVGSLLRWLRAIMDVLQTAASSHDFYERAARAVVDVVGLDSGRALLFEGEGWRIEGEARSGAEMSPEEADNWRPSRSVLRRLRAEKRTFWEDPEVSVNMSINLQGLAAVVAAPVLDRSGTVIGALYGERLRKKGAGPGPPEVTELDAMLMELIATGVAAGLARVVQERAAMAAQVQFEQFFTPELARELALRPDLLKGQDRDVTLLFADVRGFSRISERIGSAKTLEWIGDVMGSLSECVLAHDGVLVDYVGDELIAMWGAPKEEPDHPRLACRAALDMVDRLPEINARWEAALGEPMGLGIGINTGTAQVGNTGSSHKFKYGALGNTVNLASRVQGATKHLKAPLLVTGATSARLGPDFALRRLGRVAVVNIAEPVDLHELGRPDRPGWEGLRREYEEALALFERGEFRAVAQKLGNVLAEFPDDGPALVLLSRAVDALVNGPGDFDPVWRLSGK